MKKTEDKYLMNRELSWLKFNDRVLDEAGNSRVPLAERLTFASIYQSNLDEFYMIRVGMLMDQMEASEEVRENKTNMTSEEQVKAIVKETRELDLEIDESICTMYEYFEIFLGRMMMCRQAAEVLGAKFKLLANGSKIL